MINLKIEDYCQECPDFEAEVEKITFSDLPVKNDTLIRCKNHVRCLFLYEHLKDCLRKE